PRTLTASTVPAGKCRRRSRGVRRSPSGTGGSRSPTSRGKPDQKKSRPDNPAMACLIPPKDQKKYHIFYPGGATGVVSGSDVKEDDDIGDKSGHWILSGSLTDPSPDP